jgi:hypothetical protein
MPVLTGGDSGLVDQGDLRCLECFEEVKGFSNSWTDGLTCNPCLVLLGIHAAPVDYAEADVNNVVVGHHEVGASCKCRAGEEAEDKCVETVGKMPVGCHALMVCFAILRRSLTIVVDKPHDHADKNDVWFAKVPL